MAGTSIDDATLHRGSQDCRVGAGGRPAEAGKVRAAKENVAARWQGEASNTFQNVIDAWLGDTDKLLEALNGISELLDKTGATHRPTRRSRTQMFNQFNSAINR